jgi:hypothetical protein
MASVVTINRPDVVALIEKAAEAMTGGNKTELVATAVRRLLDEAARAKPLFGAHPGSVKIRSDADLIQPVIDPQTDAESGREIRR